MTLRQFDNGYWYATQLKEFGEAIGIPSAGKLRKDELESAIRSFLVTGKAKNPTKRNLSTSGVKDVERGLSLELAVVRFTNDQETKSFLRARVAEARSGSEAKIRRSVRFNRWREEQLANGVKLTYRDLVEEYVRLNQTTQPFSQIPHPRYVNFMSDFLAARTGATREQAIRAWAILKTMDAPKTYSAWARAPKSN